MRAARGGNSLCGDTFISAGQQIRSQTFALNLRLAVWLSHNGPSRQSRAVNILCLASESDDMLASIVPGRNFIRRHCRTASSPSRSFNVMTAVNSALTAAETISHSARPCLVVSRRFCRFSLRSSSLK